MLYNKHVVAAAWGLRLRSRDLAKFGLLYMNYGKWGNTQILDTDWVKHSLNSEVSRPSAPGKPQGYGFQFWVGFIEQPHYKTALPSAIGNGGQCIFFWRDMDILLVFTGGNYNRTGKWDTTDDALGYLVPAVKEMHPYINN
jgi:CubicO group peptidase (beta-lactamase class C family)